MNTRRWLPGLLGAVATLALLWGLWPAWLLWQDQDSRWQALTRQRMAMQAAQQEAQALQQKSVPSVSEAQAQIQSISRRHLGASATPLPDGGMQIQINGVAPQALALGWDEIRQLTSASVQRTDLAQNAQGWSGTLVFKLAQKP
ncbi:MAG: hypothetical protein QM527_10000 [Alphaproteobacteria bacterium]|nr:hypothetical protein [Alphaproteobacteria bacterium]